MSIASMSQEQANDKLLLRDQQESDTVIAPLPRISIQAFCETQEIAGMIEEASADRRMTKTIIKIMTRRGSVCWRRTVRPEGRLQGAFGENTAG